MTFVATTTDSKGSGFGIRHLQAALLFFGIAVTYLGRVNVGVSVVAMTNAETTNPNFMEFDWSEMEKSLILSSFYWGYCLTQFLGGYCCKKYGTKITLLCSIAGSATASIITPLLLPLGGWQIYCGIRVLQGCFQGLVFPCVYQHLAKWSPNNERNRLGALSFSGMDFGTVLAMGVSGFIATSSLGWPGISYIAGAIGLCWAILWLLFAASSPPESKYISKQELKYIESNQDQRQQDATAKPIPMPWKAACMSMPLIACTVAKCTQGWGFTTMLAETPAYMNGVLYMDMKKNALFSTLPYLVMWMMSYVYLIMADVISKRQWLSLVAMRKTYNSISAFIPAVTFIGIGYLSVEQKPLAIVLVTINVGVNSASTIGNGLNLLDLAPNHAGVLTGVINTLVAIIAIITPLIVGAIVTDEHDRSQWQIVFLIAAVIFATGNVIYLIFGSTEVQPWNEPNFLLKDDKEGEADGQVRAPPIENAVKKLSLSSSATK